MKLIIGSAAAMLLTAGLATAADVSSEDFVKDASAGGAAEVAMGHLGAEKATNAEVKAFANKMVTDHTKANKELAALAKTKNLEVNTEPSMMQKGTGEKLKLQKADADFNHDYMEHMVSDHEKDIKLFEDASSSTKIDPELKAWAKKTLPTLQMHLKDAQALEKKTSMK